jgi:hypothetical protein
MIPAYHLHVDQDEIEKPRKNFMQDLLSVRLERLAARNGLRNFRGKRRFHKGK